MNANIQPQIFIVDDDIFYLKLIEQHLTSAGYTQLFAYTSGAECLNNLHLRPNIILLDYHLEETNGIEILKHIKLQNPDAYVFFLSAQEEIGIAIDSIKHGAFGYVVKNQHAFTNILEEIKAILNYQSLSHQEDKKLTHSRFVGLRDYIAEREQNELMLIDKNNQLTKLNAEIDKFVYSASHDLRGPLTSLMGLIKVAQMEDNFDKSKLLQAMEKTVNKMDSTVKDIINYSANNRAEIKKEKVDFEKLINETFEHLKYLEGASDIEKKVFISQQASFLSDISRLRIVFTNLISNAIKYHDFSKTHAFIHIHIEAKADKVSINISDNGSGINEAYMPKLFVMFSRGTAKSNSSGLGLFIVKEVINKLNGTIELTTKVGEGTNFQIELPNVY